jgi:hypothetical protein
LASIHGEAGIKNQQAITNRRRLQRRCGPDYGNTADKEFAIYYGSMGNADDVKSRPAVIKPALRHSIEFLWFQAKHLGGNNKPRTSLLLFYVIIN